MLKLSSNGSDVFPKVLKLSFAGSECKTLVMGPSGAGKTTLLDIISKRKTEAGAYTRPLFSST